MKSYYFTLLLIFLFTSSFVTAQQNINYNLIKSVEGKGKKYRYQDKIYAKGQLYGVLLQDPVAAKYYRRYKTKKVSSVIFFGASAGLALTSYSYFKKGGEHDPEVITNLYIALFSAVGSLGSAGVGTLFLGLGSQNFHQSVQTFNGNVENTESLGEIPPHLNFQFSENGVGLVLNF